MTLSVVIPAYNEEENIEKAVWDVFHTFPKAEIIVVNDKSTDRTLQILKKLKSQIKNLRYISNEVNMGHGTTVIRGIKLARGTYILYIDADRQISLSNFKIYKGYSFVTGYRVNRHDKPFRKMISFCLKMTNFIWHRYYIKDANCPFKIYKASTVKALLSQVPETMIIPIACLEVIARQYGFATKEIPTLHKEYGKERKGFLQTINFKSLKFFWDAFIEITSL